jgi:hypothetical protein
MRPDTDEPTKLKMRAYACRISARRVKEGLMNLVESSGAFNESWLNGQYDDGTRIGGLSQYGDIIVRHHAQRPRSELTIEHRAGDAGMVAEIEATFGRSLTPKEPRMAPGGKRPEGLAYFFEMIRSSSLKDQVLIADGVIEEAHDLHFRDYRAARSKLEFLGMFPRLGGLHMNLDVRIQKDYKEACRVHPNPTVCLHDGRKVALPHRVTVPWGKRGCTLSMHFAMLKGYRVLIGWVEERIGG